MADLIRFHKLLYWPMAVPLKQITARFCLGIRKTKPTQRICINATTIILLQHVGDEDDAEDL